MITEVYDVGSDALRITVSTEGQDTDAIGPVFPGQGVLLQGPPLKAPLHVTVSSPMMQKEETTFTLHCLRDATTAALQSNWKDAAKQIRVVGPFSEPRLKISRPSLAVFSQVGHRPHSLAPLLPILKSYLKGTTEGMPQTLFLYVIIHSKASYRWLMAGFEEEYRGSVLPRWVRLAVHLHGGLQRSEVSLGTALENSFSWPGTPWPIFKDLPRPEAPHFYSLVVVGSAATWSVVMRGINPQHYRVYPHSYGFYAPVQYMRPLPTQLPPAVGGAMAVDSLFRKTDPCALGLFRMVFGAVLFVAMLSSGLSGESPNDYPERAPWGPPWLYPLVLLASALGICTGVGYRVSCVTFLLLYTRQWLLDCSTYSDSQYLVSMLALCLSMTNANAFGCVRVGLLGPRFRTKPPSVRPIPHWNVVLFKVLLSSMYFWRGVAKLNADWAQGYAIWALIKDDMHPGFKYMIALWLSWVGLVFDLCIPIMLSRERTRLVALLLCHAFYFFSSLFSTDCVPYLMHATSLLFLSSHVPRSVLLDLLPRAAAFLTGHVWLSQWLLHLHTEMAYYEDEHMFARLAASGRPPAEKAANPPASPMERTDSSPMERTDSSPMERTDSSPRKSSALLTADHLPDLPKKTPLRSPTTEAGKPGAGPRSPAISPPISPPPETEQETAKSRQKSGSRSRSASRSPPPETEQNTARHRRKSGARARSPAVTEKETARNCQQPAETERGFANSLERKDSSPGTGNFLRGRTTKSPPIPTDEAARPCPKSCTRTRSWTETESDSLERTDSSPRKSSALLTADHLHGLPTKSPPKSPTDEAPGPLPKSSSCSPLETQQETVRNRPKQGMRPRSPAARPRSPAVPEQESARNRQKPAQIELGSADALESSDMSPRTGSALLTVDYLYGLPRKSPPISPTETPPTRSPDGGPVPNAEPALSTGLRKRRRSALGPLQIPSDGAKETAASKARTDPHTKSSSTSRGPHTGKAFPATACPGTRRRAAVLLLLGVFAAYHTLMPLRAFYFWARQGHSPSWSEHGMRFSWRQTLRSKQCTGGFTVIAPNGTQGAARSQRIPHFADPIPLALALAPLQCSRLRYCPQIIGQQARALADYYKREWSREVVGVYADIFCSLNGRPMLPFTDPEMDFSELPPPSIWDWAHAEPFLLPQTSVEHTNHSPAGMQDQTDNDG